MRPPVVTASLLLPAALLLGCTDSSTPTRPTEQTPARPEANGAVHLLLNVFTAWGGAPNNTLVVVLGFASGTTAADICAGTADLSSAATALAVVTPPGGFIQAAASGHIVPVLVFQFSGVVTSFCDLVGARLVATGNVLFSLPVLFPSSGVQVIHGTADGIVQLVSGGQARLFATLRVTVNPSGTLSFDQELVQLTPL